MMEISFSWCDLERSILYMRLAGSWEMDASRRAIDEFQQRVRTAQHPVDLIAHAVDSPARHPPVWVLRLGVNAILSTPKNLGVIVLIPNNSMFLALADASIRLLGARYTSKIRTAATLAEARQLIHVLRQL